MSSLMRCACGVKFETKGLAAGTRRHCPVCHRDLIVPKAAPRPSFPARVGRRNLVAGSAVLGILVVGAGAAFAFLTTRPASVRPADAQPAVVRLSASRSMPIPEPSPPSNSRPSYLISEDSMLPSGPMGIGSSGDSPLIPPR